MIVDRAATKSKTPNRKEIDERLLRRSHEIRILEPVFTAAQTAQQPSLGIRPTQEPT